MVNEFYIDENNIYDTVIVNIDGEEMHKDIYTIQKTDTLLDIDNFGDIALYTDITPNIILKEYDTNEVINGILYISIYDSSKKKKYYNESFLSNSNIIIKNDLAIGNYIATIEYHGNKYYNETISEIEFNVTKRAIECIFDEETYYGDIEESISCSVQIIDAINRKYIPQCPLTYTFDNGLYHTQTNSKGKAYLNIIIPTPDISHCNENNEKVIYPLEVSSETDSYILDDKTVNIVVNKSSTDITVDVINDNNIYNFIGNVFTNINNIKKDVKYGLIDISLFNQAYTLENVSIDDSGNFDVEVDVSEIFDSLYESIEHNDDNDILISNIKTKIEIIPHLEQVNVKDDIIVNAEILSNENNKIDDGMISFYLYDKDDNLLYRYVTEVNNGMANFVYHTSQKGIYNIQAKFYSIGVYKESNSNEISVEVK